MAELETPITTQEQFDEAIRDRLSRESKKYEGYTSPKELEKLKSDYDKQITNLNSAITAANEKAANYDKDIAERDAKIKGYETNSVKMRIAHEAGLPYGMHTRLSGETEEEIKKDAETLAKAIKSTVSAPPMPSGEKNVRSGDEKDAAYRAMLRNMKGE